jgi:putative phosphoesterase
MRVGVVSDTHNHLANVARIVEILNAARVERVVHTGDITQAKTLHALAGLEAPLVGVFGNNDLERDALENACSDLGLRFEDPPLELVWHERRIVVTHDPLDLAPETLQGADVLLHGHDHRHASERKDGTLVFNPGECAGHLTGHNAVGILDLARLETGIVKF